MLFLLLPSSRLHLRETQYCCHLGGGGGGVRPGFQCAVLRSLRLVAQRAVYEYRRSGRGNDSIIASAAREGCRPIWDPDAIWRLRHTHWTAGGRPARLLRGLRALSRSSISSGITAAPDVWPHRASPGPVPSKLPHQFISAIRAKWS